MSYLIAIAVNLLICLVITKWPGWESFAFVTPAAADVVPWITLSLVLTIVANVVYLVIDRVRVKALGDMITGVVALVATWLTLSAFPFDFSAYAFPWALLLRIVLVLAVIGTAISIVVNLVRLIRGPRQPRVTST